MKLDLTEKKVKYDPHNSFLIETFIYIYSETNSRRPIYTVFVIIWSKKM